MPHCDRSRVCRSGSPSSGRQVEVSALARPELEARSRVRKLKRAETCEPSGEGADQRTIDADTTLQIT